MNQPLFLHIVERLEGFLAKLPEKLQKPILHELVPLKELFLKQRSPRIVLAGSHKLPVQEVFAALFAVSAAAEVHDVLVEVFRWQEMAVGDFGNVNLLDARGADEGAIRTVVAELAQQPADIFLCLADGNSARPLLQRDIENLAKLIAANGALAVPAKVIGVSLVAPRRRSGGDHNGHASGSETSSGRSKFHDALTARPEIAEHFLQVLELPLSRGDGNAAETSAGAARLMALLARELPNEARVEMIRISRDRGAQNEIAQVLVKSTSAMCAAIGAQPIPLADMPVLTTLQLVMVSGIMYVSGRERSLRASTEFLAALGVNVGAGMILREGTRAVLKFFPGWGNVVCGMVAGAGTYALGKAATAYFIEGVSLKDARLTYVRSRKKSRQPKLLAARSEGENGRGGN